MIIWVLLSAENCRACIINTKNCIVLPMGGDFWDIYYKWRELLSTIDGHNISTVCGENYRVLPISGHCQSSVDGENCWVLPMDKPFELGIYALWSIGD